MSILDFMERRPGPSRGLSDKESCRGTIINDSDRPGHESTSIIYFFIKLYNCYMKFHFCIKLETFLSKPPAERKREFFERS